MADGTKFEWTDATWTPVKGCTRVSPGCGGPGKAGGCYAEIMAARFSKPGQWGEGLAEIVTLPDGSKDHRWTGVVRFDEKELLKPLHWRRPREIFVCSTSDLFHEKVEDAWIDRVFAVMALCPQHTFQVLTKRPERMRAYLTTPAVVRRICTAAAKIRIAAAPDPERFPRRFHKWLAPSGKLVAWTVEGGAASDMFRQRESGRDWPSWVPWPLPNVWLGTSTEDQPRADERIPHLLATPAAVWFISAEPLLGPIDLEPWLAWPKVPAGLEPPEVNGKSWGCQDCDGDIICNCPEGKAYYHEQEGPKDADGCPAWVTADRVTLDWVIAGGESGPGARPMHPDWVRGLRDQCAAAGVPFFFKQWGEWVPYEPTGSHPLWESQNGQVIDRHQIPDLDSDEDPRSKYWTDACLYDGDDICVHLKVGKHAAGTLLDGVEHRGMPA